MKATRRTGRYARWIVSGALILAACGAAAAQPQAAVAESWAAPVHVASGRLRGVSCASSAFCVAVGEGGQAFAYDGSSWDAGTTIDAGHELQAVSCPTASFCAAAGAGGQLLTFNGATWSAPTQASPAVNFAGVSCVSATFCMAVSDSGESNGGQAAIYNGATWSGPSRVEGTEQFDAVSCISPTFCMATTHGEQAAIFRNGVWEQPPAHLGLMDVQAVSCVSETFCVATSFNEAFLFNGSSWGAGQELWDGVLRGVSCPSSSFCMTVGAPGQAASFSAGSWSAPVMIDGGRGSDWIGVSCPSSSFCAAVDLEGNAVIYGATPPASGGAGASSTGGGSTGSSTMGGGGGRPVPPPVLGQPPASVVYAALAALLHLKPPTISALLKTGGWGFAFTAPGAGVLRVEWITPGAHTARNAKPTVIATATKTFSAAGRGTVHLQLTAAARRLMRHRRSVPITETATFRAAGSPMTLKRAALSALKRRH